MNAILNKIKKNPVMAMISVLAPIVGTLHQLSTSGYDSVIGHVVFATAMFAVYVVAYTAIISHPLYSRLPENRLVRSLSFALPALSVIALAWLLNWPGQLLARFVPATELCSVSDDCTAWLKLGDFDSYDTFAQLRPAEATLPGVLSSLAQYGEGLKCDAEYRQEPKVVADEDLLVQSLFHYRGGNSAYDDVATPNNIKDQCIGNLRPGCVIVRSGHVRQGDELRVAGCHASRFGQVTSIWLRVRDPNYRKRP
jgi:hypothetical protein